MSRNWLWAAVPTLLFAVLTGYVAISSNVIELDGVADPIYCGSTLFSGPEKNPACTPSALAGGVEDAWILVAVTACLIAMTAGFFVRDLRRYRRAQRNLVTKGRSL